jgi:hypothetical protein
MQYLGRFGNLRVRPQRNARTFGMVERCEKCGSRRFEQTTVGYLTGYDRNKRTCHVCGHQWRPDAPGWDKLEVTS